MNPFPLRAPDGRVYAYACGRCHHVSAGSSMAGRDRVSGPIALLVEASLGGATSCCTCRDCGATDARGGLCKCCRWWWAFRMTWSDIGAAIAHGITTPDQWRRVFGDDDD